MERQPRWPPPPFHYSHTRPQLGTASVARAGGGARGGAGLGGCHWRRGGDAFGRERGSRLGLWRRAVETAKVAAGGGGWCGLVGRKRRRKGGGTKATTQLKDFQSSFYFLIKKMFWWLL